MLLAGMFAWTARYTLFAYWRIAGQMAWMLIGGTLSCTAFAMTSSSSPGQIYTDQIAPKPDRPCCKRKGMLVLFTPYGRWNGHWRKCRYRIEAMHTTAGIESVHGAGG